MIQLDVELPNRPGELGKLASLVGDAGINVNALSAESGAGRTYLSLIVDQPAKARGLLLKAGYGCTEKTVLVVRLPDRPKALAILARKLGDAGVNITSVIHLESIGGHAQLALGVDDLARARALV